MELKQSMDIKAFYKIVDQNLRQGGNSLFDKFKLENSDLISAISESDSRAVAEALKAWVNPNKPDGLERMALPMAVDNNNELIVGMLLSYKANPNVLGRDGESALYKAVFWENENVVRLLLDKGAAANFPNKDGKTAVQLANENGYKNLLAILTNDEVQLRVMQLERDRATHAALKERAQKAKAQKLNTTLAAPNNSEDLPSITSNDQDESALQTKYATYSKPMDALIAAIKTKDTAGVRMFAEKVDDLNVFENGENALQLAIERGQDKLANYLLDQGASLFLADEIGNYPMLNSSVQHKMYDVLRSSLETEENVAEKINDTKQSFTAQFLAYKDPKMMDLLLQFGADPFFGGKDGISPIVKAIEKGSVAILPVLSKRNIKFNQRIDDKSLMQWAIEFERPDWVNGLLTEKFLEKSSKEEMEAILSLAESKQNKAIIGLLKHLNRN